jgi:serine/threonine-protein phosphatase 2B catalytic subunit
LAKAQAVKICRDAIEILKKEPNLMKIEEPVVIVGDVHGQYYDVCHMLEKAGSPTEINYLFLGDFVDRGIYGTEVMLLLLSLKLNYPQSVILLRGNHESRSMTENFTFRQEVLDRYDEQTYEIFLEVFNALPLACIVDEKYLAMHGGISPDITKIEEINLIDRFQEVPLEGAFCDLLWSDPMKDEAAIRGTFNKNTERDCSVYFGKKPLKKMLDANNLMSIVRGH